MKRPRAPMGFRALRTGRIRRGDRVVEAVYARTGRFYFPWQPAKGLAGWKVETAESIGWYAARRKR